MKSTTQESLEHATTRGAPIFFLQPDGALASAPMNSDLIPVVRISIRPAFLDDRFKSDPSMESIDAIALVDTGADHVYMDEDFAACHRFLSDSTSTVHGATGTTLQKVHPALFKLADEASHPTMAAEFTSAPLRRNGRNYDIVLGMRLLSHGVLVMDFRSGIYRFEFTGQSNE
ncbi:retropepsin-like aspartic protease [Pseudomonas syringae]|uniref:retropepsin-like aspartic protease n=1 Tax=Pseudomonas syringae TaxID=317 RepID=UPI0013C2DC8B|nr:retropepsin-like aspartic protease [Pseudomonas syringae]